MIALLAVLHDPRRRGVLCFEEPENGINEGRLPDLIGLLRRSCTDLMVVPEPDDTLTQIIVNTHSPAVLELLAPFEVVGADLVTVVDPKNKSTSRKTRMRPGATDELPLGDQMTRYETLQLLKRKHDPEEMI